MDHREITAALIAPILRVTGYRFSKEFRHAEHGFKAFVFKHVSTVSANLRAGI